MRPSSCSLLITGSASLRCGFELTYTKPIWDKVLGWFGTTPEAAFGPYTAENAIPWYTVMFFIACILSVDHHLDPEGQAFGK